MAEQKLKVAIVYDWIDKWGGVERLLKTLHEMFPRAPFYTSFFDPKNASWARGIDIKTSFIQSLPGFIKKSRMLSFIFFPFAFESLDLSQYDVVISVTSSFAKAVVTKPNTLHLCILLTPTRYLWVAPSNYLGSGAWNLLSPYVSHIKRWDAIAAKRPDQLLSISREVSNRCKKHYGALSEVLYPPFDLEYWKQVKETSRGVKLEIPEEYYLVVSRLEPYKRIDVVIEAFNHMPERNLLIVGKGSRADGLKSRARLGNIRFMQDLKDSELGYLYAHAKALIMPQNEDFGYTAVEAQFFGCPVLAYGKGGVRETVENGRTGLFFSSQSPAAVRGVLERYDKISYNLKHETRQKGEVQAQRYSKNSFKRSLENIIKISVQKQNIKSI